jgi:hypothetical protein
MTQAMRGFASWVTGRAHRTILLAIVLAQFVPLVSGALLVLDALHRGPRAAMLAASFASAGFLVIGIALGAGAAAVVGVVLPLLVGAASGALLARSRSLTLAFQVTILGCLAAALATFALAVDPVALGRRLLDDLLLAFEALGLESAFLAPLTQIQPLDMTSMLLSTVLAMVLASLMLGCWWHSLIASQAYFGDAFRRLRLGRVAALLLLALVAGSLLLDTPAIAAVAPAALLGFLFQGLAVLHARRQSDGWHPAILVVIYLSLATPLARWVFLGVSAVGVLDNFFSLRARTPPRA